MDDYDRLRGMTEKGTRFAIIGDGFIGSGWAAYGVEWNAPTTPVRWADSRASRCRVGQSHNDHMLFFYSDFVDLGYEPVGELGSRLAMVADWKVPFRERVIYYLRDGGCAASCSGTRGVR